MTLKPYHYLLATLASASITVACQAPNPAKPALTTTPANPPAAGATTGGSSTGGGNTAATGGTTGSTTGGATAGGSTGGSTSGGTTAGGSTGGTTTTPPVAGGTTTPPAGGVTTPGVGTGVVTPPASSGGSGGGRGGGVSRDTQQTCDPGDFTQVERLARPAVNEGLVLSNNLLNAFNAIPPTLDLDADNATLGETVTDVQEEVLLVLSKLGNNATRQGQIAGAFLPDVMRINTEVDSGYAESLETVNTIPRPAAGRLITDDTIDITLSVLVPLAVRNALSEPANDLDVATAADGDAGVHSDYVDYDTEHRWPQNAFPYLVPPH